MPVPKWVVWVAVTGTAIVLVGIVIALVVTVNMKSKSSDKPQESSNKLLKNKTNTPPLKIPVLDGDKDTLDPFSKTPTKSPKYSCDFVTGQCTEDPNGTLDTCDECEKQTYFCDTTTWTCRDSGMHRDSASVCKSSCQPDLRVTSTYQKQRSDTNADGEGAYCARTRYREIADAVVPGTATRTFKWTDTGCDGYRCCTSHYCDPSGVGQDPYSVSVCPTKASESECVAAINSDVPAYCEWNGSSCIASSGETSACAACVEDTDCPGTFGAFKCITGVCTAQGSPKCDVIHQEDKTDEMPPPHVQKACHVLFAKDTDTTARICSSITDGDECVGTYVDRDCVDKNGKVWLTERTYCGARTAPSYPTSV